MLSSFPHKHVSARTVMIPYHIRVINTYLYCFSSYTKLSRFICKYSVTTISVHKPVLTILLRLTNFICKSYINILLINYV